MTHMFKFGFRAGAASKRRYVTAQFEQAVKDSRADIARRARQHDMARHIWDQASIHG